MSIITSLGSRYENLPAILQRYEEDIDEAEGRIKIQGKTLAVANREQAGWASYYDTRKVELKALVKLFESRVSSVRGRLFRKYTENASRELSDRAKDKYIDHDEEYTNIYDMLLEVEEIYEKMAAIVEAFKTRGYALRNLTDLVVNQLTDYSI